MRAKEMRLVITFATTTAALALEGFCTEQALPGRLIPVPTAINAECGMCWRAPLNARDALQEAIASLGLEGCAMYELLL